MLFSSWQFIFVFLPITLAIFFLLPAQWRVANKIWLILASFFFYAYWKIEYVPLLVFSILFNYSVAEGILRYRQRQLGQVILIIGISLNLLLLGYYKYTNFIASALGQVIQHDFGRFNIILPLAISFFTFTQIGYLVDVYRDQTRHYRFVDYALFVVFFPHLIAGPIVRHWEVIPQFADRDLRPNRVDVGMGLLLFLLGLYKKLLIADQVSEFAIAVYGTAEKGLSVTCLEAWIGTLAYAMQIYFDFSGYSDMAIGLALLFGFVLPVNFDAPYRAQSLRDFWRRWHMTLSRFLRDYLYIPFGGNRHGLSRQLAALLATMTLGGLWHGAGWTFVLWGAMHGVGLAAGVLWRRSLPPLPKQMGWALLMVFLLITWVLFRAPSLAAASDIFSGMLGLGAPGRVEGLRTVAIAAAVAMLGPTSQQFVERLRPRLWVAPVAAAATVLALLKLGDGPAYEFIYFRF